MKASKLRLAVLFGGRSAEHEISLISARNVFESIDTNRYHLLSVGITREGEWFLLPDPTPYLSSGKLEDLRTKGGKPLALIPGAGKNAFIEISPPRYPVHPVDVVLPILHGPGGEDGTIQGLLDTALLPYVGAGVTGSAIGMDKDVMKRLLREGSLPVPHFVAIRREEFPHTKLEAICNNLGYPLFVKPASLGSSVGIRKANTIKEVRIALDNAFCYDTKVIIEEAVCGREIECSVLDGSPPSVSLPGEIRPRHEFYSYEAKYLDQEGAELIAPAALPENTIKKVQQLASRAFRVLCCEGMARVDFFIRENGEILFNEINTIPGFTNISMYPRLWKESGLPMHQLLDRLIENALEHHRVRSALKVSYQ